MKAKKQIQWHRVRVPTAWRPKEGEELIGTYITSEIKDGHHGEYKAHHIKIRPSQLVYVTGVLADALFAVVPTGAKVKLVFVGYKKCENNEFKYKVYELFTEEAIELKLSETA